MQAPHYLWRGHSEGAVSCQKPKDGAEDLSEMEHNTQPNGTRKNDRKIKDHNVKLKN